MQNQKVIDIFIIVDNLSNSMISTSKMRELEDLSEKNGISKLQLMKNAGLGLYNEINKQFDLSDKKILIVCGSGNNGGDGFVLARYLKINGNEVKVLFLGKENKLKKESGYNYNLLKENLTDVLAEDYSLIENSDIIIDAMLGTGVQGKIREPFSTVIDLINNSKKFVIVVDIPTGLNPDTGEILDKAVNADIIYTFHDIKTGLKSYKEKVVVVDIGL